MSGRRSLRRDPRKPRAMKKRILICVEGENTEIRYFQSLIQELRSEKTHVFVDKPKGTDPMSILTGDRKSVV